MATTNVAGGEPTSDADIMNDPAFDNNTVTSHGDIDKDTCRICRSEGTPEEPLFYPCKCSGSIKHVHQECLMTWLSHTNKKHCELCKTSFRFTKLYDADMPDKLPFGVFITRACLHICNYFLTWMRAALVGLIWLVILPWAIRWAWRGLFYMMDAGWAREPWIAKLSAGLQDQELHAQSAQNTTVSATKDSIPEIWAVPIYANFVMGLWNVVSGPWKSSKSAASLPQDLFLNATSRAATSTLLSDLDFAQTLTDSPAVNRAILDVMEGQIITIVVVVAFILVFLIREWVIQQQPILNAAAHVREAEQQLDRVERARQRLRDEIRVVEEQLEQLNDPTFSFEQANTAQGNAATSGEARRPSTSPSPQVDWALFERRIKETTENWLSEDQPRSPESIALVRKLTEEVVEIVEKAQDLQSSDVQVFGQLIEWVRKIPPDVDSSWLSGLAAVFSQLKPQLREASTASQVPTEVAEEVQTSSSSDGVPTPESWEDETEGGPQAEPAPSNSAVQEPAATTTLAQGRFGFQESPSFQQVPSDEQPDAGQLAEPAQSREPARSVEAPPSSEAAEVPDAAQSPAVTQSSEVVQTPAGGPDNINAPDSDAVEQADSIVIPIPDPESVRDGDRGEEEQSVSASRPTTSSTRSPSAGSSQSRRQDQTKQGMLNQMYEYFWGDIDTTPLVLEAARIENAGPNDAQVVELVDNGDVPHAEAEGDDHVPLLDQDPEVLAAAAEAGLDAEAVEDAEDLEGILELIGMQGPIAVLFQTALFCGLLVTVTLWGAVGAPYLFGKLALQILGDPVLFFVIIPLRTIAGVGDFVLDSVIFFGAAFGYGFLMLAYQLEMAYKADVSLISPDMITMLENAVIKSSERAVAFIGSVLSAGSGTAGTDSYFLLASLQAHHSLNTIKAAVSGTFWWTYKEIGGLLASSASMLIGRLWHMVHWAATWLYLDVYRDLQGIFGLLSQIVNGKMFSLTIRESKPVDLDPILSYWSGADRALTILMGYTFLALIGFAFILRTEPIFSSPALQKVEKSLADVLKQAGGVVKVILIISIEMLMFPLYCGTLLDIALMPLFEGVTMASRLEYAQNKPYMFAFLHWFLGTAYMFNFALFVSMCRRILRSGVLYFIRDPDDPTFHPVRDVLERSISTQLRKIAFSGLVYGMMVIMCLGGIVWGFAGTSRHIFPLRWSTPDPVLEFPAEFLFYNFFSPILLKLIQPSRGLEATYEWWLRKCARRLRLSHFLFGERNEDEERVTASTTGQDVQAYMKDGMYVRVPASDQVRVQRGQPVFVPVTEEEVVKGEAEQECSLHGRPNQRFRNVYVPSWFRLRIGFFLGGLWMLCAAIGITFTIWPLVLGRGICALLFPDNVKLNDIWAYSIGLHVFILAMFLGFRGKDIVKAVRSKFASSSVLVNKAIGGALCAIKSLYVYGFIVILVPTLAAFLIHFFAVIPARTYLHSLAPPSEPPTTSFNPNNITSIFSGPTSLLDISPKPATPEDLLPLHNIYLIPDWTLGLVLSRFFTAIARASSWTLPAAIWRQLTQNGVFNPDIRLANRAIVLPTLLFSITALLTPLLFASGIVHVILPLMLPADVRIDKISSAKIYRYAYPVVLAHVLAVWGTYGARKGIKKWKERIKDEVYLVGERLHNFGEKKPPRGTKGVMKKGKEPVVDAGEEPAGVIRV
ncbi:RING-variant domain-containing protein 1 [Elsinoe fawcettii]|nr:RING-variant domain-containing protein 1 [Elsinoe fawcettii]